MPKVYYILSSARVCVPCLVRACTVLVLVLYQHMESREIFSLCRSFCDSVQVGSNRCQGWGAVP